MVRGLAPVRMPDGSDEALKECPFAVGYQVACQAHLLRRDELESQGADLGKPFCQHDLEYVTPDIAKMPSLRDLDIRNQRTAIDIMRAADTPLPEDSLNALYRLERRIEMRY